jgi:hypothetical protein
MRPFLTATLSAVALLGGALTSQSGPLIGFTANAASSNITVQRLCDPPLTDCTNALPVPSQPYAGGLAYDPMRNSTWHTQGTRILEIGRDGCPTGCAMAATRAMGTNSLASGLKIDPATERLYELETIAGVAAITEWQFVAGAPCPRPLSTCRIVLPSATHHAGALAFDQKRRLIYVASSVFGAAVPANTLLVLRQGDPSCTPICTIPVRSCLTGLLQAITAMTFDECSDTLYLSDGRQTSVQVAVFSPTSPCPVLRPVACCVLNHPAGETWYGFDIMSIVGRRLGGSCTSRPCPNCPNMSFDAVGAAVPGNGSFGFRFDDAPTGARGYVFINFGACSAVPLFCGTFFPALVPPPIGLGPILLNGAGVCDGTGFMPVPIPNDFNLCNALLCVQGLVVCSSTAGIGLGLTNAVVVPIGS